MITGTIILATFIPDFYTAAGEPSIDGHFRAVVCTVDTDEAGTEEEPVTASVPSRTLEGAIEDARRAALAAGWTMALSAELVIRAHRRMEVAR